MERIVYHGDHAVGVEQSDVRLARDMVSQDISKLYLMSYYWTILAMTTVGNLPHPTTKVQYVYVIFQLLGKLLRLTICSAAETIQSKSLQSDLHLLFYVSLSPLSKLCHNRFPEEVFGLLTSWSILSGGKILNMIN